MPFSVAPRPLRLLWLDLLPTGTLEEEVEVKCRLARERRSLNIEMEDGWCCTWTFDITLHHRAMHLSTP